MIKHIVIFKSSDENKITIIDQLKRDLEKLPENIKEIKYFETGLNISKSKNAYDLVLISEFESEKTLEKYRIHPDHQKIIDYILENKIDVRVVDYNF